MLVEMLVGSLGFDDVPVRGFCGQSKGALQLSKRRRRVHSGQLGGRLEAGWKQAGRVHVRIYTFLAKLEAGWRQAGGRLEARWGQAGGPEGGRIGSIGR